jgi:hypothetical protein
MVVFVYDEAIGLACVPGSSASVAGSTGVDVTRKSA